MAKIPWNYGFIGYVALENFRYVIISINRVGISWLYSLQIDCFLATKCTFLDCFVNMNLGLFQLSSVQSLSRVQLFATPWITACQASLFITISQSSDSRPLSPWCHPATSNICFSYASWHKILSLEHTAGEKQFGFLFLVHWFCKFVEFKASLVPNSTNMAGAGSNIWQSAASFDTSYLLTGFGRVTFSQCPVRAVHGRQQHSADDLFPSIS